MDILVHVTFIFQQMLTLLLLFCTVEMLETEISRRNVYRRTIHFISFLLMPIEPAFPAICLETCASRN